MSKWTIKSLLTWTTEYFQNKGIESARLDAEVLLAHFLNIKKIDLYLQFDRPMTESELSGVKALIKRRVAHEPVAYIVGKKEFWSRDFIVNKNVLIPRPETEFIIESALDWVNQNNLKDKELNGFEIGLGSGCIAITLLCDVPNLKMQAVEISEEAIEVAKKNAETHGVINRLEIISGDFLNTNTEHLIPNTDIIVSNPPYVAESEKGELSCSVREYEPMSALFAEKEGLEFYPKIAEFAKNSLRDKGFVAVETGEKQGARVKSFFEEFGFKNIEIKKDFAGHDRVVECQKY